MQDKKSQSQVASAKAPTAHFTLRALLIFAACLLVGVGIYLFSLHHHANVAQWGQEGSRETLIYEDTAYRLRGEIGDAGLSASAFATEELLGEVKPPKLLDFDKPLLVWTVKGKEDYLVVVDGNVSYVYLVEKETTGENEA